MKSTSDAQEEEEDHVPANAETVNFLGLVIQKDLLILVLKEITRERLQYLIFGILILMLYKYASYKGMCKSTRDSGIFMTAIKHLINTVTFGLFGLLCFMFIDKSCDRY